MGAVYLLTLRQLAGRWRLLIMTALAAMPVAIALMTLSETTGIDIGDFEAVIVNTMLAGSIAPLVVLAIAAAAFGNEIEDRTLANLTLAPIPRWQIVAPKLLAAISLAGLFMAVSAFGVSYLAFLGEAKAIIAVASGVLIGVLLYASAFVWLGLVSTQAIGLGLLYIVLWEGFLSRYVAGVRLFSIRGYSIALMHGFDERRFAELEHVSTTVAIVAAVGIFLTFLLLSVSRLRRLDIP